MPNIFPPIDPQRTAMVQPDQAAILGTVGAPSGASLALNSADNAVQAAQDKLAGDAPKKYDYGAHGVLGNIGHVLARTANIAGDILDPAATSLIPNSDLYNAHKRAGDLEEVDKATERQLAAQRESDSVANETANLTQKASEFEAEAPGRAADTRSKNAQAELAENGKYQVIPTPQGYIRVNPSSGEAQHVTVDGKPVGAPIKSEHVQLEIGGKPHTVLVDSQTGNVIHDLGPTGEKPPTVNVNAGAETVNVPDGQGGYTVQRARPGDHIAAGAVNAAGMSAQNTPTAATRAMVESAPGVIQLGTKLKGEIAAQRANLGPGSSRERAFMSGTIGTSDPQYTALRNDAGLLATKLMKMHVGSKGSEAMMEHFSNMLNVKNQSPDNLDAAIDGILDYAQSVAKEGNQGSAQISAAANGAGSPPAGAKVRDYTQLGKK